MVRHTLTKAKNPSERELQILHVLWREGPSTVRKVRDALQQDGYGDRSYTTVLTLMQIMAEKGLVWRDETARTHLYSAAIERAEVEASILTDLIERLFHGSALSLAAKAAELKLSPNERKRLMEFLEEMER